MRRRDILAGAGSLAAGGSVGFPAPAIAQATRRLKMVTDWPEGTPGLQASAIRFAQTIGVATGGRISIDVFPAGALVRPFETFDAVAAGVADMYHSDEYYFERSRRHSIFSRRCPLALLRTSCSRGSSTVADRSCGTRSALSSTSSRSFASTPVPRWAGGSRVRSPSPEGFKGLRYRMPGLGAEVLRRLGAIVVTLPGSEIVPALKSGAIDASEWVGPMARHGDRAARGGQLLLLSGVP